MARKHHKPEEIVGELRQVEVGSVKNLGHYAASWIACRPKRPSGTAALT